MAATSTAPRALTMTRDAWIDATKEQYWSALPDAERRRLAGSLWDRIRRLGARLTETSEAAS